MQTNIQARKEKHAEEHDGLVKWSETVSEEEAKFPIPVSSLLSDCRNWAQQKFWQMVPKPIELLCKKYNYKALGCHLKKKSVSQTCLYVLYMPRIH